MGRISNSWRLMRQSWGVLRHDRSLMVFPAVSALASLAVAAAFLVPVAVALYRAQDLSRAGVNLPLWAYPALAAVYFVMAFVTIYFNSALMGAAMARLRGEEPTLREGFAQANSHLPAILGWALVTATVGMLLRALQERLGFVGTLVAGLAGLAWQFVTYFVVPVLIFEGVGPVAGIKRSASLVKQRWGEQIAGTVGIGAASGLLALPGVLLVVAGVGVGVASRSFLLGGSMVGVGVVWLVLLTIVTQAMQGIYNCALYRFATQGDGGGVFSNDDLARTFRTKDGRVPLAAGTVHAQVPPSGPVPSYGPLPSPVPSPYMPEPAPPGDILPR